MIVLTVGVATVLYTFSFVMARLVEGDLESRWVRRRRERMLDELTDHFIICGFGRMGFIIAQEFMRQKVPFVIIERNPERMQQAIEAGFLAVEADASSELVLKRVRIEHARGFIAAVSTDAENVYAVLTARLLRPDLYIIGRAETEDARSQAGAGGSRPRRVSLPDRRAAAGADRPPSRGRRLRADCDQLREPRTEHGTSARSTKGRRSPGARSSTRACASALAWSSSASSAPTAGWSSTRRPTRRCAPGIISSCSATSTNCASSRPLPVNPARPFGEPHGRAHSRRTLGRSRTERRGDARRATVHGSRRAAARAWHRARRRRSRLGDLRPRQDEGGWRIRDPGRAGPACPRPPRSTSSSAPSIG